MTSPQFSLLPAGGDDRFALLAALELVSSGVLQFGQIVGAEVGQGVPLEPGPQVLDRVEVRRVAGQQRHLYSAARAVEVFAHDTAFVLCRSVHTISSLRLSCMRSALSNSTICALLIAPSCSRNMKLVRARPATTETYFQLKWNWITGVQPLGAQVRTRVGRSERPDSSIKMISRRSTAHFF